MKRQLKRRKRKDYPLDIKVDSLIDNFTINQYQNQNTPPRDPLQYMIAKESFNNLSREAKFVISLIIWSPLDLFVTTKHTTKQVFKDISKIGGSGKAIIQRFLLKKMNLYPFQAKRVINEIQSFSKNI